MKTFVFFVSSFFLIYVLLNFYIGLRGWQYLFQYVPFIQQKVYWVLFWLTALSYLAARLGGGALPEGVRLYLTLVGSYWMAAMFYLFQVILVLDIIRYASRFIGWTPGFVTDNPKFPFYMGLSVLILVGAILVYGAWNARNPRVQHYEISIPKKAGDLQSLHVVAVSDIHLGEIIHNGRLSRLIDMVNTLDPDLVLLPGDIIDEDMGPFVRQDMTSNFLKLQPQYGVYAVPGNHEYFGRQIEQAISNFEEAGIKVLRDTCVKVEDSFYVAGRDDITHIRMDPKTQRRSMDAVLESVDRTLPIILMNHQPTELEEAARAGVDLQISGHTHVGQIFPNHLITKRIFEIDWGYLRKDNLQVIVSSGYGTWGPPIRTGNRPEVVDIIINFTGR